MPSQFRPSPLTDPRGGVRYCISSHLPSLSRSFSYNSQNQLEDIEAGAASRQISPFRVPELLQAMKFGSGHQAATPPALVAPERELSWTVDGLMFPKQAHFPSHPRCSSPGDRLFQPRFSPTLSGARVQPLGEKLN